MANLPTTPDWSPDVYQIKTTDKVLGGPDGVINVQAKQLADRTDYLKQEVEAAGALADSADSKADSALAQIAAVEAAAGSATDAAAEALAHRDAAQAAEALAVQARQGADAAAAQAGDSAQYAAEAAALAGAKATEAQSAATAATAAASQAVNERNQVVALGEQKKSEIAALADSSLAQMDIVRDEAVAAKDVAIVQAQEATIQAGVATNKASVASGQANIATTQAGLATTAKIAAEAARDAAQLSAGVYATTAAGLAATTNGRYFSVPSGATNEYLILYLNSSGTAVEKKRYPSTAFIDSLDSGSSNVFFLRTIVDDSDESGSRFLGYTAAEDFSLTLYFSSGVMENRSGIGNKKTSYTFPSGTTTINLPAQNVLLWNISTNTLVVQLQSAARPNAGYVLLAFNNRGQIADGKLVGMLADVTRELLSSRFILSPVLASNAISVTASNMTVDLSASGLFFVSSNGTQVAHIPIGGATSKTLAHNQELIWDFVNNTLSVVDANARKPWPHLKLAEYRLRFGADPFFEGGALFEKYVYKQLFNGTSGSSNMSAITSQLNGLNFGTTDYISRVSNLVVSSNTSGEFPLIDGNVVTFTQSNFYAIGKNGNELKNLTNQTSTFTFSDNEVLIWNWDSNTLVKQGNNAARPNNYLVLLYYKNSKFIDGKLLKSANNKSVAAPSKSRYSHITFSLAAPIVSDNVVTFNGSTFYAIGWDGKNVKALSTPVSATYTFADNEVLIWDWDTNALTKISNNATRPSQFVSLLHYKTGSFVSGEALPWLLYTNRKLNAIVDSKIDSSESRCFVVTGKIAEQGITVENDRIWSWKGTSYPNNNVSYTSIGIYDANTFAQLGTMTHNFGHAATVDYNAASDVMVIGNGESNTTVLPRLDFLLNASTYAVGSALDWNDNVATPKVSINFFAESGGVVTKQIGGSGAVACFGEQPHIVYMMTGQGGVAHRVFKVLLGTGANNFSDATGTDLTKWGTFISGKGANELNGTAKILRVYTGLEYDTSQGLCFHEGKLYYGITSTADTIQVIEVEMLENGTFRTTKSFKYIPVDRDGTTPRWETEGTAILNGRYLLAGGSSYEGLGQRWVIFPLYNEMGGKGTVGTAITYPFSCNSTPQPMITPTSDTVDLYVSSATKTGFTVQSKSGGSGTFNWVAKIS